jgi:hypothetical protein
MKGKLGPSVYQTLLMTAACYFLSKIEYLLQFDAKFFKKLNSVGKSKKRSVRGGSSFFRNGRKENGIFLNGFWYKTFPFPFLPFRNRDYPIIVSHLELVEIFCLGIVASGWMKWMKLRRLRLRGDSRFCWMEKIWMEVKLKRIKAKKWWTRTLSF